MNIKDISKITSEVISYYTDNIDICKEQYDRLMTDSKSRGLNKKSLSYYTEEHHIIPRCMGGTDTEDNLVLLTYKEHILAHMLLYILYPENYDLTLSFGLLIDLKDKNFSDNLDIDLESLNNLKLKKSEYMKNNNPMKNLEIAKKVSEKKKGVPTNRHQSPSKETREKISNTLKELYSVKENHPFYGKHHIKESIEKIKKNRKGKGAKTISEEHKQRLREYQSKAIISPDGIEYKSIKEAAKVLGITRPSLSRIINHHPEKGWKFKN